MNLLLDTHIWIWYLEGNPKISQNLKSALEDDNNRKQSGKRVDNNREKDKVKK